MKVGIYTLGCKVNIYESEYVTSLLIKNGYEIGNFDSVCDIYIINTCMVTNESERKDRKIINQARKRNESAIIVVMGCYSQYRYDEIDADIIIGNKDKSKIVELIEEYLENNKKITRIYDLQKADFEEMEIDNFYKHSRAFVKIQDGCNAYCSYCIIPYVRGRIRSKDFDSVICEVSNLVKHGYKEIVLTGIHTGRYGIDKGTNLECLLRELIKIPNIYRIRLSSIEINEITDGIISLYKESDILAKHLHIPLQSGSDKILKLMNRRYDLDYFINRTNYLRKEIPDISITTDLIVGFPNETDDDFLETIDTLKKNNFSKIHTFPYSKRNGTPASRMDNQVDGNIKKERVREVIALSNEGESKYYSSHIGKVYEVITELRGNMVMGYTSNYMPVVIEEECEHNIVVKVKIINVIDNICYGKII